MFPFPSTTLPAAPTWQIALTLAPALTLLGAILAGRAARAWRVASTASTLALGTTLASLAALIAAGSGQAFGTRADPTGAVVGTLVAFVGWVIVRYSQPYLANERGEAAYLRWLLVTLASVLAVVSTNHLLVLALAWSGTSLALHRLLTFFDDRPAAMAAAHKKFVFARVADVAMLCACTLLAITYGTLRIDTLALAATTAPLPVATHVAVVLVALAALLKCAQLPFHGWLIQVMEAPTPVSALLHAGVVNLGALVLVRIAPLLAEVPVAAGLLVVVGAFTAIVAALVTTTRISIKVALAWSTCAQMGFMLMQCGLGLWTMGLLHLVAHSLYKAHAFLSAGGAVRQTMVRQLGQPLPPAGIGAQTGAAAMAVAMTVLAGLLVGPQPDRQPALWVMAGILALALAPMLRFAPSRDVVATMPRAAATAFGLACVYFALHTLLDGRIGPPDTTPAVPWWAVVAPAFALLFVLQCVVTARPGGALATRLYPWFYGGLFLDDHFGRAVFRLWPPRATSRPFSTAVPDAA